MNELIFGAVWTLFTAFCTWIFYGFDGGTIYVNGEVVSQEEFGAMLAPKLFIGLFWIVGIIFIVVGVVKCIKKFSELSYENNQLEKNNFDGNEIYSNTTSKEYKNINGKLEFYMGIIIVIFMIFFTSIVILSESAESNKISILIFSILFWFVGITLVKTGIKKFLADRNTEQFGEECYGRIYKMIPIGEIKGKLYYKVEIIVYVPSERTTKIFTEDIGCDLEQFQKDSYLRLLYYNDDVNIKEIVDENNISKEIKNKINNLRNTKIEEKNIDTSYYKEQSNYNNEYLNDNSDDDPIKKF